MKNSAKDITYIGIAAAIIFLAGFFIKIPVANGYYNLEDAAVAALALILGKKIIPAAAIGASLVDLLSGMGIYAIPSGIIYALAGLLVVWIIHLFRNRNQVIAYIVTAVACETAVLVGYMITWYFTMGAKSVVGGIAFLVPALIINFILILILLPAVAKVKDKIINQNYKS